MVRVRNPLTVDSPFEYTRIHTHTCTLLHTRTHYYTHVHTTTHTWTLLLHIHTYIFCYIPLSHSNNLPLKKNKGTMKYNADMKKRNASQDPLDINN